MKQSKQNQSFNDAKMNGLLKKLGLTDEEITIFNAEVDPAEAKQIKKDLTNMLIEAEKDVDNIGADQINKEWTDLVNSIPEEELKKLEQEVKTPAEPDTELNSILKKLGYSDEEVSDFYQNIDATDVKEIKQDLSKMLSEASKEVDSVGADQINKEGADLVGSISDEEIKKIEQKAKKATDPDGEFQSLITWAESEGTNDGFIDMGPLTEEELALFEMSDAEYAKLVASIDTDTHNAPSESYENGTSNAVEMAPIDFIGADSNFEFGF